MLAFFLIIPISLYFLSVSYIPMLLCEQSKFSYLSYTLVDPGSVSTLL